MGATPNTESTIQLAGATLERKRHVCGFFNGPEERYALLLPYIVDGLHRGDRAFHIIDPETRDDHMARLEQAGVDVEAVGTSGQLEVLGWEEAYLRGGRFDQNAMLALIETVLGQGPERRFPLTRLVAHMEWGLLPLPGVEDIVEYESRLNYVLPKYPDPVICTYDIERFSAGIAFDILRTHPMAIIGGLLQENPFYIPPDEFLRELRRRPGPIEH